MAEENFARVGCELHALSNLNALMKVSAQEGFMNEQQAAVLRTWMADPGSWTGQDNRKPKN